MRLKLERIHQFVLTECEDFLKNLGSYKKGVD